MIDKLCLAGPRARNQRLTTLELFLASITAFVTDLWRTFLNCKEKLRVRHSFVRLKCYSRPFLGQNLLF